MRTGTSWSWVHCVFLAVAACGCSGADDAEDASGAWDGASAEAAEAGVADSAKDVSADAPEGSAEGGEGGGTQVDAEPSHDGSSDAGTEGGGQDGPLQVAPGNARWFQYGAGSPVFLCGPGDPEGFLYRGKRNADGTRAGDQEALLQKVAASGANTLYFHAVRSHGGDGESDENPFVNSDPGKGLDADILAQWNGWLSLADSAGIVPYLFLYDDSARIWNTGDTVGAAEQQFVDGIVTAFRARRSLVWVIAEEYAEAYSAARVSSLAARIRALDAVHPIAVHKNSGLDFAEFAQDPSIDQFAIQYNVSTASELHSGMLKAYAAASGGYSLAMAEAAGHGTGATARKKNWATALGGAYVLVLGWDIESTSEEDLEGCGVLSDFLQTARFDRMHPHDELGTGATEYVLALPGQAYVAYSSAPAGALGLKGLPAGSYSVRWVVPASGQTATQTLALPSGDALLARPAGFDTESAVYVERL